MKQLLLMIAILAFTKTVRAQETDDGDDQSDPVQAIIDQGFTSFQFMQRCVSVGEDGSEISTEPLPVGDGRELVCNAYQAVDQDATSVLANDGKVYCVLGALSSTEASGDERLDLEITDAGESRPAQVEATAQEPITISMVNAFGGALAWPIWLTSIYQTQQVVPDLGDGTTCRELFGLATLQ